MKTCFQDTLNYFNKNKKVLCILLAIIALGIFLRSCNFYGFQRFDEDHVRDALVVQKMDQDKNFMIEGPVAKYTDYHLGPIYYYFTYISYKTFGDNPGNLAYPALIFSILSIPLFYLVLKKFFSEFISLGVTAIYAVSFNSVEFSRFEWNCNLIPFFLLAFIYALLKIIEQKEKPKIIWPVILGIVIGIGVQLHTMIIFIFLPILAVFFAYFLFKKFPLWKSLIIIIAITFFLNIPSLIWDINNKWVNTRAFLEAVYKENVLTLPPHYYLSDIKCYIQGNSYVLSPMNQTSSCEIFKKQPGDSALFHAANLVFMLIFFAGGIALFSFYLKKEKDLAKKYFLLIIGLYLILAFIVFLPMAYSFDKRYFIAAFFLPYVFLGFWLKFFSEKLKLPGIIISAIIIGSLFVSDFILTKRLFVSNPNPFKVENEYAGIDLKKTEEISDYIAELASAYQGKNMYVSTPTYMRGYRIAIKYFVDKKNPDLKINAALKSEPLGKNSILFFVEANNYSHLDFDLDGYSLIDKKFRDWYGVWILEKN